jgi:hypothetical protein
MFISIGTIVIVLAAWAIYATRQQIKDRAQRIEMWEAANPNDPWNGRIR